MVRRIILVCLAFILVGGVFAFGQSSTTIEVKPPKKMKVKRAKKPPKPPQPRLTSEEKAVRNANIKNIRKQQRALEKQQKQAARSVKAQQKAYAKALRAAENQAKKK